MKKTILLLSAAITSLFASAQTVVTFNNINSVTSFVVPCVDSITIEVKGGQGGFTDYGSGQTGGLGSDIKGTFAVTQGQVLKILAGGMGQLPTIGSGGYHLNGGGGGGSFVWDSATSNLFIAAGGGGGANSCSVTPGGPGLATLGGGGSGGTSACGLSCDNGNGVGGGGAGWLGNGAASCGTGGTCSGIAYSPLNGGLGGVPCAPIAPYFGSNGGFGGGGAGDGNCGGGGGGGGYTGGNGGGNTLVGGCSGSGSTGGTSYNIGVSQTNNGGTNSGDGVVIITYTASSGPSVNINSITNVLCNGGNNGGATATATCGTPPYAYNWTPSGGTNTTATGLTAGTYTMTVTDNLALTGTASVTITQPTLLVDSVFASSNPICKGSCTAINVATFGGTPGYSYIWNNGSTATIDSVCPAIATVYTVTTTDANGCTTSASVAINFVNLGLNLTATKDSTCTNFTKDSLIGSPVGGTYSGAGVTGRNFNPSVAGVGSHLLSYAYTDTVNDCSDTAYLQIIVTTCTGVQEVNSLDNQIKFYPDPFTSSLNLNVNVGGVVTLTIFNSVGENLGTSTLKTGSNVINTQGLPAGVYMMRVKTENGELNKRLVKMQ